MEKKIASMPKETAAELLYFIAENERFSSVTAQLKGGFTVPQVRALLREVAAGISNDVNDDLPSVENDSAVVLSSKTKDVIASLSPEEGQKLLSAFGLRAK